jgi:hypothetical protein
MNRRASAWLILGTGLAFAGACSSAGSVAGRRAQFALPRAGSRLSSIAMSSPRSNWVWARRLAVVTVSAGVLAMSCSPTSSTDGPSPNGNAGGQDGGMSCEGYPRAPTTYLDPAVVVEQFPAIIQGNLDIWVDYTAFQISLPDGADISVRATMPLDGDGITLDGLRGTVSYDPETNTDIYEIPMQIRAPGTHELRVFSGNTGTGPYEVQIQAFDRQARACDPSYVDPAAGVTDITQTRECDALMALYGSGFCIAAWADDPVARQRFCGSVVAPCLRSARESLACLSHKGTCNVDAGSLEELLIESAECTPRAEACP